MDNVSFIAHEADMARMERINHRLFIVVIVLTLLLFGTNAGWLAYESQFQDEVITQEVTQEADNGSNRFVGGDYYGTADSQNND